MVFVQAPELIIKSALIQDFLILLTEFQTVL